MRPRARAFTLLSPLSRQSPIVGGAVPGLSHLGRPTGPGTTRRCGWSAGEGRRCVWFLERQTSGDHAPRRMTIEEGERVMSDPEPQAWSIGRARKHVAPKPLDPEAVAPVRPRGRHPSERGTPREWISVTSNPNIAPGAYVRYENDEEDTKVSESVTYILPAE